MDLSLATRAERARVGVSTNCHNYLHVFRDHITDGDAAHWSAKNGHLGRTLLDRNLTALLRSNKL